jgi:hypothetical protein
MNEVVATMLSIDTCLRVQVMLCGMLKFLIMRSVLKRIISLNEGIDNTLTSMRGLNDLLLSSGILGQTVYFHSFSLQNKQSGKVNSPLKKPKRSGLSVVS